MGSVTTPVVVLFALLAALSSAVSLTTQHIASTGDRRHSKGWRFILYLFHNPLWLFGWAAMGVSFIFQAIALHNGQRSIVQPLLVTELVFGLVLRRYWIDQADHLGGCGADLPRSGRLPSGRSARGRSGQPDQRSLVVRGRRVWDDRRHSGGARPAWLPGSKGGVLRFGGCGHVGTGGHVDGPSAVSKARTAGRHDSPPAV